LLINALRINGKIVEYRSFGERADALAWAAL
jgi:hypothetical protein